MASVLVVVLLAMTVVRVYSKLHRVITRDIGCENLVGKRPVSLLPKRSTPENAVQSIYSIIEVRVPGIRFRRVSLVSTTANKLRGQRSDRRRALQLPARWS